MILLLPVWTYFLTPAYSISHEYKEWDDKNPQLVTCNQNTKNIIQGSTGPQEVDTDKEVVFTYDVTFKVPSNMNL